MSENEKKVNKNSQFSKIKGWLTIEEIHKSGSPVVKIFNNYLITAKDEYLHKWIRGPKFDYWPDNIPRWKEAGVKNFSDKNLLKDFNFSQLEEKASEWSKEIESQ